MSTRKLKYKTIVKCFRLILIAFLLHKYKNFYFCMLKSINWFYKSIEAQYNSVFFSFLCICTYLCTYVCRLFCLKAFIIKNGCARWSLGKCCWQSCLDLFVHNKINYIFKLLNVCYELFGSILKYDYTFNIHIIIWFQKYFKFTQLFNINFTFCVVL